MEAVFIFILAVSSQLLGSLANEAVVDDVSGAAAGAEDKIGSEKLSAAWGAVGNRIVNGKNSGIKYNPWQASIRDSNGNHFCGGALIGLRWVLSAAHCFETVVPSYVVLGTTCSYNTGCKFTERQGRYVAQTYFPRSVRKSSKNLWNNDFALLELQGNVRRSNTVGTIPLWRTDQTISWKVNLPTLAVTGWGKTNIAKTSNILQQIEMPMMSNQQCKSANQIFTITDNMICTKVINEKDICQGDSGGPLVYTVSNTKYLVGIATGGTAYYCGTNDATAVFAEVADIYNWVWQMTKGTKYFYVTSLSQLDLEQSGP